MSNTPPPELTWTQLAVMAVDIGGPGGIERLRQRLVKHYAPLVAEVVALRARALDRAPR